jgi:hypothetical protein
VRQRGLLSGPDVAPLEGVDTVELAMLEALADTGDRACATCSPARSTPCPHRMGVRDHLLRECGHQPHRPKRMQELLDKAWEPALEALEPPSAA